MEVQLKQFGTIEKLLQFGWIQWLGDWCCTPQIVQLPEVIRVAMWEQHVCGKEVVLLSIAWQHINSCFQYLSDMREQRKSFLPSTQCLLFLGGGKSCQKFLQLSELLLLWLERALWIGKTFFFPNNSDSMGTHSQSLRSHSYVLWSVHCLWGSEAARRCELLTDRPKDSTLQPLRLYISVHIVMSCG